MYRRIPLPLMAVAAILPGCGDGPSTPTVSSVVDVAPPTTAASHVATVSSARESQLGELYALQSALHGALHDGDREAMRSLWADDAVLHAGGNTYTGPDEIADFFAGTPQFQNRWAAISPMYKSEFVRHGETASIQFECVFVEDGPNLTGSVVQLHLNGQGTARKIGSRWYLQEIQAGAGAL